ncbi:6-carboxytetrahydropterin synthase [Afipia sp. 1NLS2]|uniref:6-pyruvoyl trahydropterin synthase family protein n=1 Tax=Afipia sp. 1NLS2 TaxID=666684 RepID=UPI0001DA1011|nr:6-pyruvoyl tetrahydropterin synthase and hypothetical protein [Afipia sp. 1NLS2]
MKRRVDTRTGFVVDFLDIEQAFSPLLKTLGHHQPNDAGGLKNPTTENIAIWIWDRASPKLPQLFTVKVYETPDCWAEYDGIDVT